MARLKGRKRSREGTPRDPTGTATGKDRTQCSTTAITGWKLRLFRAAAVVLLGVVVCGTLELGLRLCGYGYPSSFFLVRQHEGEPFLIENPKFLWRFMPRNLARAPRPIFLPEKKATHTLRVFVLGESAAMGDPEPAYGIPQVLRLLLSARYPGKNVEVINVAVTAINSHVIVPLARECARLEGDFWFVYMGNNEVHGPFGPGTAFGQKAPRRGPLRLALALQRTRTGQLIEQIGRRFRRADPIDPSRGLEAFLEQAIDSSDPRLLEVYNSFEANLNEILSAATASGTRVVLSTVGSNLRDFAPLGARFGRALSADEERRWRAAYSAALPLEAGAAAGALERLHVAEAIEPNHADLQFQLGTRFWQMGNHTNAQAHFLAAREQDTLRFRADLRINGIIRATARAREGEGIHFIDAEQAIADQSAHAVPGEEWFWDHVHFRFPGNYLVARLAAEVIAREISPRPGSPAQTEWLTIDQCADHLGMTYWSQHQLTATMIRRLNVPPFSGQSNAADRNGRLQTRLQNFAGGLEPAAYEPQRRIYREALAAHPDDWNLHDQFAKYLEAFGHEKEAIQEWRKVIELIPHHFMARFQIGHRLAQDPATVSEALPYLREASHMRPYAAEVRHELGMGYAKQGNDAAAGAEFAAALGLDQSLINTRIAWAVVLERMNQPDEAARQLRSALALRPDNIPAHFNLANLLAKQNQREEALLHFQHILRLNPEHREALEAARTLQLAPAATPPAP